MYLNTYFYVTFSFWNWSQIIHWCRRCSVTRAGLRSASAAPLFQIKRPGPAPGPAAPSLGPGPSPCHTGDQRWLTGMIIWCKWI